MSEKTLQVFIDGVVRYFDHIEANAVKVGTPYLVENNNPVANDITGIIGVTGPYRGCVYFTAPRILIVHLLLKMGETDTRQDHIFDLVGEVANTISGNARGEFGKEFNISVPVVVQGAPKSIYLPTSARSYVIPIYWKTYSAAVVISLSNVDGEE